MGNEKKYDLEERTYRFARNTCDYAKKIKKALNNVEYLKQLLRSSSSVGANYIEANESLGQKDFKMRIRICRKESKESAYWLKLIIETNGKDYETEGNRLYQEANELKRIFSAILLKS